MSAESFLTDQRNALQAFTEADPYFLDVPIISEKLKDIEAAIDRTIGATGGVCVLLVTPSCSGVLKNARGLVFERIRFVARVLEDTTANDTGKGALDVAIHLAARWLEDKPDTLGNPLVPGEPTIALGNDPKFLSYDVSFTAEGGTVLDTPQLGAISANVADLDAITLAHTTPGAAIFYTTAAGQPIPRNPLAALYEAPFAAASGTRIRARAWLAGYLPSPELSLTV